jgi:hypothetical protein
VQGATAHLAILGVGWVVVIEGDARTDRLGTLVAPDAALRDCEVPIGHTFEGITLLGIGETLFPWSDPEGRTVTHLFS